MPTLNEHIRGEPNGDKLSLVRQRLLSITRGIERRGRDARATSEELEQIKLLKEKLQEIKNRA